MDSAFSADAEKMLTYGILQAVRFSIRTSQIKIRSWRPNYAKVQKGLCDSPSIYISPLTIQQAMAAMISQKKCQEK